MDRDLDALLPLPAAPYDPSDTHLTQVSSLSLIRYRTNDYSVPVAYGHREVLGRAQTVLGPTCSRPWFSWLRSETSATVPNAGASFGAVMFDGCYAQTVSTRQVGRRAVLGLSSRGA